MRKHARIVAFVVMAAVSLVVVGCDQGSKAIARTHLGNGKAVVLFGGILVMRYVENQGAFLSLGAWLPEPARRALFIAFPLFLLVGLIIYAALKKRIRASFAAGLSLVAGGGIGNLLDRILHGGRVGDFLNLGIGSFRTGIFNLADLSIMLGCLLLVIEGSGGRPGERPEDP